MEGNVEGRVRISEHAPSRKTLEKKSSRNFRKQVSFPLDHRTILNIQCFVADIYARSLPWNHKHFVVRSAQIALGF